MELAGQLEVDPGSPRLAVGMFHRWIFFSLDKKRGVLDPNAPIKQPPKTAGFLSKHLTFSIQNLERTFSQIVEINVMHNTSDL